MNAQRESNAARYRGYWQKEKAQRKRLQDLLAKQEVAVSFLTEERDRFTEYLADAVRALRELQEDHARLVGKMETIGKYAGSHAPTDTRTVLFTALWHIGDEAARALSSLPDREDTK